MSKRNCRSTDSLYAFSASSRSLHVDNLKISQCPIQSSRKIQPEDRTSQLEAVRSALDVRCRKQASYQKLRDSRMPFQAQIRPPAFCVLFQTIPLFKRAGENLSGCLIVSKQWMSVEFEAQKFLPWADNFTTQPLGDIIQQKQSKQGKQAPRREM